ncbi:MAG: site-2 protease family protein [Acidobacteria bacterium]|nr:site-2 protease family protein [Acidobacteriota bacterium]
MDASPETLLYGVAWYVVFVFSLTVHEASHAWAALKLGDETAYRGGQVTLNPIPHILREPFGTVVVPLLSFALMGWMMGWASAPYDPHWAARHPKRAGLMALAGPVSNLVLMLLAAVGLKIGFATGYLAVPTEGPFDIDHIVVGAAAGAGDGLAAVLSILFSLNFLLFLFNLVPLPPLDGAAVVQLVLPHSWAVRYQEFVAQPMFALLGLIIAWRFFGAIFWPVYFVVVTLLYLTL